MKILKEKQYLEYEYDTKKEKDEEIIRMTSKGFTKLGEIQTKDNTYIVSYEHVN